MIDHFRRVETLYHQMLARPAHERAAALAAACPDDPALAAEVQALLDQPESAAGLFAAPAMDLAARAVSGGGASLVGRRMGVFEVQGLLGSGGMGEVYRGWDTRLGRAVAIKLLPRAFKDDPDRVARFEREARVLASLNHPNIGAVYGLEDAEGVKALVMELVEGEDLSERLARGAIAVEEALPIARQIAEAVEAAHERGVIHRDLKPANIKVRPDGTVKVLDFGLAKALEPASGAPAADPTESPTMTARATKIGMILGTAAYMAPEQALGKPVDRRADIWSFGVVLYEMLTGERAFKGDDIASTLASVLKDTPTLDRLPAPVPPRITRLLERCLERDPKTRLRDIGEARIEISRTESEAPDEAPAGRRRSAESGGLGSRIAWWALVAGVGAVLAAALILRPRPSAPGASPEVRLTMPLGPGLQFSGVTAYIAVSPDERVVTFSARKGVGVEQQSSGGGDLYVRRLDRATPVSLEHKGAAQFFSPDGEWLGFFDDGKLMKIPVSGGAAVPIASVGEGQGHWAQGDVIVFSQAGDRPSHGIRRVQASGGDPAVITTLDRTAGHTHHLAPQLLPGGKHVLYTIRSDGPRYELAVVPIEGGSSRVIARDVAYGRYLGDGLLVYQKGDSLFASRLDPTEFRVSGERPVLDGVLFFPNAPAWDIAGGTLVYRAREDDGRTLLWVNRDGSAAPVGAPRKAYWNIRLSPRGDRIAAHMFDGWLTDVWTYDLGPRRLQQVTTDGISRVPAWSPDGSRLLVNQRAAIANVVAVRLDGRGAPEDLTHTGQSGGAAFMTRDERFLVTSEIDPVTGYDLMLFDLKTPGPPSVLVRTPKLDAGGKLHPSGRWVAYASTVTGRDDVFVTPFPAGGTRIPVTIDGGREPVWSIDGRELFYRQGNRMFSVAVRAGAELTLDPPRLLFDVPYFQGGGPGNTQYDVASDGRFLMMKAPERETPSLQVVLNWTEALRKAVGGS